MLGLGGLTGIGLGHLLGRGGGGIDLGALGGASDISSALTGLAGQIPAFAESSYDPFSAGLMSLNQAPQSNFNVPQGMTDFNQMAGLLAGPIPQMQQAPQQQPQQRRSAPSPVASNIMQDPRNFLSGAYFRGGF